MANQNKYQAQWPIKICLKKIKLKYQAGHIEIILYKKKWVASYKSEKNFF